MIDALLSLALIFFIVSGIFCIGAIVSPSRWIGRRPMATRVRRGRHYQDTTHEGHNTPW